MIEKWKDFNDDKLEREIDDILNIARDGDIAIAPYLSNGSLELWIARDESQISGHYVRINDKHCTWEDYKRISRDIMTRLELIYDSYEVSVGISIGAGFMDEEEVKLDSIQSVFDYMDNVDENQRNKFLLIKIDYYHN